MRHLHLLLTAALVVFLSACGQQNTPNNPGEGNDTTVITIDQKYRAIIGDWVIEAATLHNYATDEVLEYADTYDKNYHIVFNADGTGTEFFTADNAADFTYTIDDEHLTTVMNGATDVYTMHQLSETSLVYYVDKPGEFRFTYRFKPAK
ncbi:MAG: lipocalin family protein [Paludibacteraceae bacterium]|nr:lipocalin family protein [Paludibacteraceae bacterium]